MKKYIKRFENFINDDNRGESGNMPNYNPKERLDAKEYVEALFNSRSGVEINAVCKEIGCKAPGNDEELDEVKEKALKYFIDNPERIDTNITNGSNVKQYPYNGGDGVVRTNNVGGSSVRESNSLDAKPDRDSKKSKKIKLSEEEMDLFSDESSLIKLITQNKISLYNNEVWYSKDDKETEKILGIYFKI